MVESAVGHQGQHGGADLLRAEHRAAGGQDGVDVDALPSGVGGDGPGAECGGGGEWGQQCDEPDGQAVALRLGRGICADEPGGGLGAGVATAQW